MRTLAFASRNAKELLRDKINLMFGILFPAIILLLLSAIQANIPVELFTIEKLAPGVAVFALSFISLFSGFLIAKDRTSSFMLRLFVSPMTAANFILGYTLPLLPIAVAQICVTYILSFFLGLKITVNVLMAIILIIPTAVVFIALGLLCGSLFNDKQVGGICGAVLTNLTAWLSGTWFDLNLVGGWFKTVADCLPFSRSVEIGRAALLGNIADTLPNLLFVLVYAIALMAISIAVFMHKMNGERV